MAEVKIYTTKLCPYCIRAKALLTQKRVAFEEIDVGNDPEKRRWLRDLTGRHTVPQIFINGKGVGGYDDIAALDRKGQLDPLLAAPGPAA
jgi:glutaredoxin 3